MLSAKEGLIVAKKAIEKYGWTRLNFGNEAVGYCMRGALRRAYPIDDLATPAYALLKEVTGVGRFGFVSTWNDELGRTKEEVLAAFEKAIALAEERSK